MDFRDRITEVFKVLRKRGIIARQNFSCCGGCGMSELIEYLKIKGAKKIGVCFYTRQDRYGLDCSNPGVHLKFSGWIPKTQNTNQKTTKRVGQIIAEVCRSHGLQVKWDGSANRSIYIH